MKTNFDMLRPNRRQVVAMAASAGLLAGAGGLDRTIGAAAGRPHVVILGAGLAGLCAAYLLQKEGCTCTILEAEKDHIGGRVRTAHFGDGLYAELGAMRIPTQHTITLGYVHAFGLPLRRFITSNDNAYYYARGQRVRIGDPAQLGRLYELRPWERDKTPDELWAYSVLRHLATLTKEEQDDLSASNAFKTKKIFDYDHLSLRQLIEQSGLSAEAIEYLLVAYADVTLQHTASTEHLREEQSGIWSVGEFYEIIGGTELLPKAFAERLQTKPRMGCEVVGIEQDHASKQATAAYLANGAQDRVTGDYVLCTIPFPVLERLDVPFSGEKRRAIHEVWYESATKVLVPTTTRFWEADSQNPIFGGGSYTDLLTGSIYYPSDNVTDRDPAKSKGPGILVASYNWGQDARRLGMLPDEERGRLAVKLVSKVHPQLNDPGIVRWDEIRSWHWDSYRFAGGAFAFYMPGQFSDLHRHVIAPERRVYFAGEHCSHSHTWMQGALESAQDAAGAILKDWNKA